MRRSTKGFTMVELMVVLAVMAILSAIVFSIFGRVREAGRNSVCLSNLKQVAVAMQQYVQDSDGRYPRYLNQDWTAWAHAVSPYIKNITVFRCPTISGPPTAGVDPLIETVYSYNAQRLQHAVIAPGVVGPGKFEVDVSAYSATMYLSVCRPKTRYEGQYLIEPISTSCGRVIEFDDRVRHHSGGTNWSFLDGHVKWLSPEKLAELSCANPLGHVGLTTNP